GECINGSIAPPRGATKPASGGNGTTSTRASREAKPKSIYKTSSSAPRSSILATEKVSQKQTKQTERTTLNYLSAVAPLPRGEGGNAGLDYWRSNHREWKDHKVGGEE